MLKNSSRYFKFYQDPDAKWLRSILGGFVAAAVYGSWAWHVNSVFGSDVGWMAAATQGALSFTMTFTVTMVMETLFYWSKRPIVQWLLPTFGTIALTCIVLYFVHDIMGTPKITKTIAPSVCMGAMYIVFYVWGLHKINRVELVSS